MAGRLAAPAQAALLAAARPELAPLAKASGCSVVVIAWDGRLLTCVDKEVHPAALAMQEVGAASADCTGTPWGWLALLDLPERERTRQGAHRGYLLRAVVSQTPALARELARDGTILDDAAVFPGVRRLAAPIRAGGRLIGALGLGGTAAALSDAVLPVTRRRLLAAAARIANVLEPQEPA